MITVVCKCDKCKKEENADDRMVHTNIVTGQLSAQLPAQWQTIRLHGPLVLLCPQCTESLRKTLT